MQTTIETHSLHCGDSIAVMKKLPDASIDLILADLPYGVTQQKWDAVIPFDELWREYLRITKPDASFVFTATQPFTSALVMSQPRLFKYDWVWRKPKGTGHLNAKKQPMRDKEDILVFQRGKPPYFPQMVAGEAYKARGGKRNDDTYGAYTEKREDNAGFRYPKQVLEFGIVERDKFHPSQKPVDLMAYLVRTYTKAGAVVLDNTMGSGSTGVACVQEGRSFIGIDQDVGYYEIAIRRITEATLVSIL